MVQNELSHISVKYIDGDFVVIRSNRSKDLYRLSQLNKDPVMQCWG